MAKWADYLISAVRYDSDGSRIVKVEQRVDNGDTVGVGAEVSRGTVVANLENMKTYVTIKKNSEGNWIEGDSIHIFELSGEKFIRTDGNKLESDNLGSLPTF